MTDGNPPEKLHDDAPATPFFSARLTPHRSLGPTGFLALMVGTGIICFGTGLLFLTIGAWPVFGFLGLDVLIIYFAFRLNYRAARAFEEIHVTPTDIHVVRVNPRGGVQEYHLNPSWARLNVVRIEDEGVVALSLSSHGKTLEIGGFLNPPDRESFAEAFGRAIATARRGGPDPAPAV